jgi:hypothetical protein
MHVAGVWFGCILHSTSKRLSISLTYYGDSKKFGTVTLCHLPRLLLTLSSPSLCPAAAARDTGSTAISCGGDLICTIRFSLAR